ncbi:hypothetical protein M2447_000894 [Ereboglobus sp. PH5-10]|nr:hypothetical protein [Ereboglobus sp. PH5-10]
MQTMKRPHAKSALAFAAAILSTLAFFTGCKPKPDSVTIKSKVVASDDFSGGLDKWVVEQMPGGTVTAENGVLTITDAKGCTVWLREKLTAPVAISYEVTMSSAARVSDMNCFWMATDPKNPKDLFHAKHGRTGQFATYDALNLYYAGYGGNANTTTRFRRYDGTGARPLLPEHDLTDAGHMLKPDHTYKIVLIAQDGEARFVCDGKTVFSYKDPKPLKEGWFGFRTVDSKMQIRNFRVTTLDVHEHFEEEKGK